MNIGNDNCSKNTSCMVKCSKRRHLAVIIFPKYKEIYCLNLKNQRDVEFILNKVLELKLISQKPQIFVHNHGIKGFYYDVMNYLTEKTFKNSLDDKDIVIFFNYHSILPYDFKFGFQWKIEIKRYCNFLNKILKHLNIYDNLNLILSGFSRGCIINTKMLNLIQEENLKNINSIYLIEEAIPKIKFLLPSVDIRYTQLKNIIFQKRFFKKIKMIIIPSDCNNIAMREKHPSSVSFDIAKRIDLNEKLFQCLNDCILCLEEIEQKQFSVFKDDFKCVKIIPYEMLEINFCPQKVKIW